MKSAFVAIIGRPNVGKSTILNNILKEKLAIVTHKAQTTRNQIKGIYNDDESQIVFIDTPGIHKPSTALDNSMNKAATSSLDDSDLSVLVLDASMPLGKGDEYVLSLFGKTKPDIVVINKIDLKTLPEMADLKKEISSKYEGSTIIEMSAIDDFNTDTLIKLLKEKIPEGGPMYYPLDTISDVDEVFRIKEIIREKLLLVLKGEVPHQSVIYLHDIKRKKEACFIRADIIVKRDAQKAIVIGKGGKMIKRIGILARDDIEKMMKRRTFLELFCRVEPNWDESKNSLKKYGY